MDFHASISTFGTRFLPFLAILRYDLRTLFSSWLVRLWLAASVLLTLLLVATWWPHLKTAELITSLLIPYLVGPWFLVVVVLGADPVSAARSEALTDGILSRPITRFEYLLASWTARLAVVLGAYLVVIVPAAVWVTLAQRKVAADSVTVYGITASLAVVGLVLTFLVSLAYLLGTISRRPLLAIVVALFIWFPSNLIFSTFSLEAFSTVSLSRALPTLFRTPWRPEKETESARKDVRLEDLGQSASQFLSIFGGAQPPPPPPPKGFFDREPHQDFSLPHVLLGYGLSTLACLGLTLVCFCSRDL
jgi:ABC-type transport system involved in multi-copper enzyme maturation permease subunit